MPTIMKWKFSIVSLIASVEIKQTMSFLCLSKNISNRIIVSSTTTSTTLSSSTTSHTNTIFYPRAAVAIVVRWCDNNNKISVTSNKSPSSSSVAAQYLLVQRGTEPNKGMWSMPGGKIEIGEGTLDAAKRELWEETGLTTSQQNNSYNLKWHNDGPFACSDSIHQQKQSSKSKDDDGLLSSNNIVFHYVISQCFAEIIYSSISTQPPIIKASDDAMDAKFWNTNDIQKFEDEGSVTKGVTKILERSELLYSNGLLQCH